MREIASVHHGLGKRGEARGTPGADNHALIRGAHAPWRALFGARAAKLLFLGLQKKSSRSPAREARALPHCRLRASNPVMPSEVENGATKKAARQTGRPQAERTGSERIKSRTVAQS